MHTKENVGFPIRERESNIKPATCSARP